MRKNSKKQNQYTCDLCKHKVIGMINTEQIYCLNCPNKEYVEQPTQLCPICNKTFSTSPYLNNKISDEHVRWLANMVVHYRHIHITSWDKSWGEFRDKYKRGWGRSKDYKTMKLIYNERAKRQILRKCKVYMVNNGFKVEHVMELKNTSKDTIKLYVKIIDSALK